MTRRKGGRPSDASSEQLTLAHEELYTLVTKLMIEHTNARVTQAQHAHAKETEKLQNQIANRTKDYANVLTYVRQFRSHVELAVRVLTRGTRQKKKASALRAARGTLEAALSEPEPASWSLMSAIAMGGLVMMGLLAHNYTAP